MKILKQYWPLLVLALTLIVLVVMNIRPYGYNLTSIFHIDDVLSSQHPMHQGTVILQVPSYDGAQYYQIARNIPKIITQSRWHELQRSSPGSYAYQRFLLPLLAFLLSLGSEPFLPYAFVLINLLALLLTAKALLQRSKNPLFAFALCLSPAAMVGLHFSLAEPLTILLIIIFLLRYTTIQKIEWRDVFLLSLLVLTREVNILFVAFLFGYSLLKKHWRDILPLLIPTLVFISWHAIILSIFGNIPFLISTDSSLFPLAEPLKLLIGVYGFHYRTLSSIALFLCFVLPGILWLIRDIMQTKRLEILPLGALAFFGIMSLMPHNIWGSITSIGRVITPVYPLYILALAQRDTPMTRTLAFFIMLIGLSAAVGLILSVHPYVVTL